MIFMFKNLFYLQDPDLCIDAFIHKFIAKHLSLVSTIFLPLILSCECIRPIVLHGTIIAGIVVDALLCALVIDKQIMK